MNFTSSRSIFWRAAIGLIVAYHRQECYSEGGEIEVICVSLNQVSIGWKSKMTVDIASSRIRVISRVIAGKITR